MEVYNLYDVLCKADDMTSVELNHLIGATERSPMACANERKKTLTVALVV
jgi:hypothetical protein